MKNKKRATALICAAVLFFSLSLTAGAMPEPPRGSDYNMGKNAGVLYGGKTYYFSSLGEDGALAKLILEENGWELINKDGGFSPDYLKYLYTVYFMNGRIFNLSYPDGLEGYDWLLTQQEYVYENGRYSAFRRQVPQACQPETNYTAFNDFDAFSYGYYKDYGELLGLDAPIWYSKGIITSVREGFFTGYKEEDPSAPGGYYSLFMPENKITRAEAVAVITRTGFTGLRDHGGCYLDVSSEAWFAPHVTAAYEAGLIDESEYFYPDQPATREFVARMLSAVMIPGEGGADIPFADAGEISKDCEDAVGRLLADEIINGYSDGTFRPGSPVTRAEYAVMLGRIIDSGLLNADTPNEAYAKAYTQLFFETYTSSQERYEMYYGSIGGMDPDFGKSLDYPLFRFK